jgi:hypothetical protein
MKKQIYFYEILGLRDKKLGEFQSEEKSKKDMLLKAEGVLMGAGVLRSFVIVRVRDEWKNIVHEIKKINGICY